MRRVALACIPILLVACLQPGASAQAAGDPGTLYIDHASPTIGATVPCDSATYKMASAPLAAGGKAYTARSFGGAACTTNLDYEVPAAFVATAPITIRAVMACDVPAASAGVSGATTSVRFIVFHGTKNLSGNVNLVGSNQCGSTPLVYQATVDLKGEEFAAGDLLQVQLLAFYTTGGAGDPNKSMHLRTGGDDPSVVIVPDLGGAGGDEVPVLYQNVTTPELRVGRNQTAGLNQTEVYNWTAASAPRLAYRAINVTGGNVTVRVLAGGTELANLTVSESGNATRDFTQAGNLTVQVIYANFTGDFVLTLGPKPAGSGASPSGSRSATTGPTGSASSSSNGPDGNGTSPTDDEDQDTPGLPLVGVLTALAAVAVALRRRRA